MRVDGNQTILVWHALASGWRYIRDMGPELEALATIAAHRKSAMNQFFSSFPRKIRIRELLRISWIPGLRCAAPGMTVASVRSVGGKNGSSRICGKMRVDGNQTILVWHALASGWRHIRDMGPELEALATIAAHRKSAMNPFFTRIRVLRHAVVFLPRRRGRPHGIFRPMFSSEGFPSCSGRSRTRSGGGIRSRGAGRWGWGLRL